MWKECYRLGVEEIDRQHKELFERTNSLIEAVKSPDIHLRKKECVQAILFLKKYSLEHFASEEAYQRSVRYSGYSAHLQMHQEFISSVLTHESRMAASDFALEDIESFIGMLTAWLAYHVADADQKIVSDHKPYAILGDCFCTAICHSLGKMAHISPKDIVKQEGGAGGGDDIAVSVALSGDISATVEYMFSEAFAMELLRVFLFMNPKSMDSLVCSILREVLHTISKNAALELGRAAINCVLDAPVMRLKPPSFSAPEAFTLNTPLGSMRLGMHPAERSL